MRTQAEVDTARKMSIINSAGWSSPVARWAHNSTGRKQTQQIQQIELWRGCANAAKCVRLGGFGHTHATRVPA